MTPLAMAVRQRSLQVSRLLLQWGASPGGSQNDGIPLLLHLADALGSAAVPSSSCTGGSSSSVASRLDHSTASSGGWCPAWPAASPGSVPASACSTSGAGTAAPAGQEPSPASCRILGLLEDAEQRLQLLHLLLQHRADPLEAPLPPAPGQPTFLTGAHDAVLSVSWQAACCCKPVR